MCPVFDGATITGRCLQALTVFAPTGKYDNMLRSLYFATQKGKIEGVAVIGSGSDTIHGAA
jgi:hypothetical protein